MRLNESLMSTGPEGDAYGQDSFTPQVNIAHEKAGQMGFAPDYDAVVMNAAYVRRNTFCLVLESPRGFNDLPNPDVWHRTLKQIMEKGSRNIEGLNGTQRVEYAEHEFHGGGEMQSDIAKITRERSIPVHTFVEKYGMPIHGFFDGWIRYLIGTAETQVPEVTALLDLPNGGPTDLLPDYTGATCLYVELDPLHKTVVKAWLITAMMPDTSGEYIGSRDLAGVPGLTEHTITFTGVQMVGRGPKALAQRLVDRISLQNVSNFRRKAPIEDRSADMEKALSGYHDQIKRMPSETI